jgi:hypothetical protein
MANSWIMALKHWNSMKGGKYVVPKKGSKEYLEVKAVQSSMINGKGITSSKTKIKNIKPKDNIGEDIEEQKMEALRRQLRKEIFEQERKEKGNVTIGTLNRPLKKGRGIVQLGKKAPKKKRGRPKKQSGRGNDDEWVDTNVNIIGELEEAGVPVPTELSLVNTVYDTFGPKAPQVNKKTGAVRPAPGLFDFLNFEL